MKMARTAGTPPTKGASPTVQLETPGELPPRMPKIMAIPAMRKTTTVTTLMVASQNSLSP